MVRRGPGQIQISALRFQGVHVSRLKAETAP
jgi:hypothetical protein